MKKGTETDVDSGALIGITAHYMHSCRDGVGIERMAFVVHPLLLLPSSSQVPQREGEREGGVEGEINLIRIRKQTKHVEKISHTGGKSERNMWQDSGRHVSPLLNVVTGSPRPDVGLVRPWLRDVRPVASRWR